MAKTAAYNDSHSIIRIGYQKYVLSEVHISEKK